MESTSGTDDQDEKWALRFVQPTDDLRISGKLGPEKNFGEGFCITNDPNKIVSLLDAEIKEAMGGHFIAATRASGAVIYFEGEIKKSTWQSNNFNVDVFVHRCMGFLLSLWLVRDHAVNLLPAFCRLSRRGQQSEFRILTFGQRNFSAMGGSEPVEFSHEEIHNACEFHQDWIHKILAGINTNAALVSQASNLVYTNFEPSSSRLLRFLSLLDRGRAVPDQGIKLALFCSGMECLFSQENEKNEIVHRVAEKTAFLLEQDFSKRKTTYKLVKQAYDLRSAVLHGSAISNSKLPNLPSVCSEMDSILRNVFKKIILNPDLFLLFTQDEKRLQDFFVELLFSGTAKEIMR